MARLLRFFSTLPTKVVPVFESKDYAKLQKIAANFVQEAAEVLGNKYYQFLPFYLESKFTVNKRFVLKMDLLPEENKLRLVSLQLGSLDISDVDLPKVVPVTLDEYESSHFLGKMLEPATFLDLEMVYLNKPMCEFLVFDKDGDWIEEGVNHPLLSLQQRFQEHEWMDTHPGPKSDMEGGKVFNSS